MHIQGKMISAEDSVEFEMTKFKLVTFNDRITCFTNN